MGEEVTYHHFAGLDQTFAPALCLHLKLARLKEKDLKETDGAVEEVEVVRAEVVKELAQVSRTGMENTRIVLRNQNCCHVRLKAERKTQEKSQRARERKFPKQKTVILQRATFPRGFWAKRESKSKRTGENV